MYTRHSPGITRSECWKFQTFLNTAVALSSLPPFIFHCFLLKAAFANLLAVSETCEIVNIILRAYSKSARELVKQARSQYRDGTGEYRDNKRHLTGTICDRT